MESGSLELKRDKKIIIIQRDNTHSVLLHRLKLTQKGLYAIF